MSKKILLNSKDIEIIVHRLAWQLIENHNDFSDTVLIGLQPRGSFLANRLVQLLENDYGIKELKLGLLDITFYRDDFRRRSEPLVATSTEINFLIELINFSVDWITLRSLFNCFTNLFLRQIILANSA